MILSHFYTSLTLTTYLPKIFRSFRSYLTLVFDPDTLQAVFWQQFVGFLASHIPFHILYPSSFPGFISPNNAISVNHEVPSYVRIPSVQLHGTS
jgi:hypothetical protein